MDPGTVGALRSACQQFRRDIARVRCWNTPHERFIGTGSYRHAAMRAPNPWSESWQPQTIMPRCTRRDWRRWGMLQCIGHTILPALRQPKHGENFWVCRPCAVDAFSHYDHTGYPPWFHMLCYPCSQAERVKNSRICTCREDYWITEYWLCSDCRRQFGEMLYDRLLNTASTLTVRDPSVTDMRQITR